MKQSMDTLTCFFLVYLRLALFFCTQCVFNLWRCKKLNKNIKIYKITLDRQQWMHSLLAVIPVVVIVVPMVLVFVVVVLMMVFILFLPWLWRLVIPPQVNDHPGWVVPQGVQELPVEVQPEGDLLLLRFAELPSSAEEPPEVASPQALSERQRGRGAFFLHVFFPLSLALIISGGVSKEPTKKA